MPIDPARAADLLREPRETLEVEIKGWLDLDANDDRLKVAKGICALANHGGGVFIIGLRQTPEGPYDEAPQRPAELRRYDTDSINRNVIAGFIQPVIHCDVRVVRQEATGRDYPMIFVPGGHTVPLRVIRQTANDQHAIGYYIRRPGPSSEQALSPQEWDQLIRRCVANGREELLTQIRVILGGAPIQGATPETEDATDQWFQSSLARWRALGRQ